MPRIGRQVIAPTIVSLLLLLSTEPGYAQPRRQAALAGLGPNSKTTLVVAVLVTTVGLIGAGVYLGIRKAHTVSGCVVNSQNGLDLQTEDNKSLLLLGNTSDVKLGERVKLTGSKKKRLSGVSDRPTFVVEKLNRIYGTCPTIRP